ncbi:MAG: glycine oxidase ThiO [Nitriliruptorales bacterium]|nr:glycine oxidase ThiO [Nitriliruptorales bacterium]
MTIVGGGAIGLATAWRAAQAGHDVTVVDPDPGRGASWAAAGMLAPVTEAHYGEEPLLALNLAASEQWPGFATELAEASGMDAGYRRCGAITVARDLDDQAALAELFAFQQGLGLAVQRMTGSEVRRVEPSLSPRVRGGVFASEDHQVDNRALVQALVRAAGRAGVTYDHRRVARIDCHGGRVRAVVTEDGHRLQGDTVIVAAGVGAAALPGVPEGVVPPLRPVKGQLLHLRGVPAACPRLGVVRGLEVYVVSRGDGRVVVGATMEERGMDTTVTAGAVMELLRAAWELLPGLAELELLEATAGLRPATPDNAPAVGPTEIEGLHLAVGHFRNGILLTPITARTVVAGLDGPLPDLMAPFSPDRFRTAAARR